MLHNPFGEHVVPGDTPAEHAVHDATCVEHAAHPAGRAGVLHHEVSDAASPAQVADVVQQQALLHLVGDQGAAVGPLR